MPIIEIEGLHKKYRRLRGGETRALDGLDLTVDEGGVFGFLGPNGAGKTTTIRCLLALVQPSAGSCRILGVDSKRELANVITRIGSIVETPAMFPNFSGRRNLLLLGRIQGIGPRTVDAVLERVGLASRANDKVRTYSLGMKQRLGIAAALLKDPELLILDEPANGLDPAGIKEVRDLLRNLGREGRTVFVSSHILSEVQQVCDRVAILARGKCVASGPVRDVLTRGRATGLIVGLDELERGAAVLKAKGIDAVVDGGVIRVNIPPPEAAKVTKILATEELYVTLLRPDEVDLETVFLELTGEGGEPT
ncbi:MAG: ABC transporter ATP-binding protein [Actinomycetota bacterium]